MSRARGRALLLAIALLALLGLAVALVPRTPAFRERPPNERPTLLLLTSLPLLFGEDFSLQGGGSTALNGLQTRYRVLPISVTDAPELSRGRLLLMAQPLAQPPEDLVALDQWVRRGGQVLLLADPLLEWPSTHPLGDPLRPSPMFADTGLLAHWGVRLDAPDGRGLEARELGGYVVLTASPGLLFGACAISSDRFVARCRIGRGRATIVADADLLDVEHLDRAARNNIAGILRELAALEQP